MSVLLKPTAILLLCAGLLTAYGDSSGGKIPEVTASAIPVISATSADTLTVTRTGNTEESRNGDVTRTITGNVNESIENGSVTINNNLMGKTVTEMMPAGDYKTEVTAMNYETMFMVNGEHKVMDMSTKKTVIDLGITDLVFDSPRSTTDANIVSETFVGVKNSNHLAACFGFHIGAKAEYYAGPKIVDKRHYIRKSSTVLDSGEMKVASFKVGKLSYKLTLIG